MKEKKHLDYLYRSVELATDNVHAEGGPFGAVIVKDGEIIAEAVNRVVQKNDPTAHAEVEAIRAATSKLNHFQLQGASLYSSCEPCPMCLGAIYWAGIEKVYFASSRDDAEKAGFSDAHIYREIATLIHERRLPTVNMKPDNQGEEFRVWEQFDKKIRY